MIAVLDLVSGKKKIDIDIYLFCPSKACYITEILIMLRKSPSNRRSIALEMSRKERF